MALFTSATVQMINKVKVESTILTEQSSNPTFSKISLSPQGGFMLVVTFANFNDSKEAKGYFNFTLNQVSNNGTENIT